MWIHHRHVLPPFVLLPLPLHFVDPDILNLGMSHNHKEEEGHLLDYQHFPLHFYSLSQHQDCQNCQGSQVDYLMFLHCFPDYPVDCFLMFLLHHLLDFPRIKIKIHMIHQHKIHKLVANGFKIVACEYAKKVISKTVSVEVSKVASIQDVVFRVVTLYSHVCGYQHFGRTCSITLT